MKQHENSFITVDPATMIAYSMDNFGGAALVRYDVSKAWKPLAPLKTADWVKRGAHEPPADTFPSMPPADSARFPEHFAYSSNS